VLSPSPITFVPGRDDVHQKGGDDLDENREASYPHEGVGDPG